MALGSRKEQTMGRTRRTRGPLVALFSVFFFFFPRDRKRSMTGSERATERRRPMLLFSRVPPRSTLFLSASSLSAGGKIIVLGPGVKRKSIPGAQEVGSGAR